MGIFEHLGSAAMLAEQTQESAFCRFTPEPLLQSVPVRVILVQWPCKSVMH